MSYHFSNNQLRVFKKYVREHKNQKLLEKSRIIILEHILPTTESMINILRTNGADIFAVVAKPYSIDKVVLSNIIIKGFNVIQESYEDLETKEILDDLLNNALEKSKKDNRKILIIDVGGYFAKPIIRLQKRSNDFSDYFAGIVEDTTFGHNRYNLAKSDIDIPIFSVARSALKEIEARFVGRDAVLSIETVLRDYGILMSGRNALVIGYGMIGKNVALALRNSHLGVSVYDRYDHRNLSAYIDGYHIHRKRELIKNADIIFFATGCPEGAMFIDEIEECKNNVVLASVGSKDTEFDLKSLKEQADSSENISEYLCKYTLPNDRHIIVANNGTAVNFLMPSLSVEVLDLVFSEILLCVLLLLRNKKDGDNPIEPHILHNSDDVDRAMISKDWLRIVNN